MKFSELVKAWEDGYRGKFTDSSGLIRKITDGGIFDAVGKIVKCDSDWLEDNTYKLIKEPKIVTFTEAFSGAYNNVEIYPQYRIDKKALPETWMYIFFTDFVNFSKYQESLWIIEE